MAKLRALESWRFEFHDEAVDLWGQGHTEITRGAVADTIGRVTE